MSGSGMGESLDMHVRQAKATLARIRRDLDPAQCEALAFMADGGMPVRAADHAGISFSEAIRILDLAGKHMDLKDRETIHAQLRLLNTMVNGGPLPPNTDLLIASSKGTRAVQAKSKARTGPSRGLSTPRAVPEVVEDLAGEEFKPDPVAACSTADLRRLLREYWQWAGEFGSRRVAAASGGAFSHATAAKLIAADPKVPLKLEYVAAMIRGCGGGEADQREWVAAFRRVRHAARTPRLKVVAQ